MRTAESLAARARARVTPGRAAALALGLGLAALLREAGRLGPLGPDELHTAQLARWMMFGWVPPQVGALTPYEPGSWLIAWPVLGLQRALALIGGHCPDLLATRSVAVALALLGLTTAAWLVARRDRAAGVLLAPLLLLGAPAWRHFGVQLWGSIPEALAVLPLLVLLSFRRRAWPLALAGGLAAAFSYIHLLTVLALAAARGRAGLRSGVGAGAVWLGGLTLLGPSLDASLHVRGGASLPGVAGAALLAAPRALLALPAAWTGPTSAGPLAVASAVLLAALGAAAVWRLRAEPRWPLLWSAGVAALLAGVTMGQPGDHPRYALLLVLVSLAALSLWPRIRLAALLLALGVSGLPAPPAPVPAAARTWLSLGALSLRVPAEPFERKVEAFARYVPWYQRPWFFFGHGFDEGRSFSARAQAVSAAWDGADGWLLGEAPLPQPLPPGRPPPLRVLTADVLRGSTEAYRLGFGAGLRADGVIDPWEESLVTLLSKPGAGSGQPWPSLRVEPPDLPPSLHAMHRQVERQGLAPAPVDPRRAWLGEAAPPADPGVELAVASTLPLCAVAFPPDTRRGFGLDEGLPDSVATVRNEPADPGAAGLRDALRRCSDAPVIVIPPDPGSISILRPAAAWLDALLVVPAPPPPDAWEANIAWLGSTDDPWRETGRRLTECRPRSLWWADIAAALRRPAEVPAPPVEFPAEAPRSPHDDPERDR